MSDSPIPPDITLLIDKYGKTAVQSKPKQPGQARDEVPIKTVIADINALSRQLGLPMQQVYMDFRTDLSRLVMLRLVYISRELVVRELFNGWQKVDLAIMRKDAAMILNMRKFELITPDEIINAGSGRT